MRPEDKKRELELTPEVMRRLVDRAMARIIEHIGSLASQPVCDVEGAEELARSLREPLPETPHSFEELLDLLFQRAIPKSFNTASPGYLAYIPAGGIFHSALADLIANAVNRYTGVWLAAPGLVQLEVNVIRWFCTIVGYPEGSGGILTTGGSLANLIAVITARRTRLPENFLEGTIYASDQVHHSMQKAALLAGFPPANLRSIPSDGDYRMRTRALEEAIREDAARGLTPFLLVGSAGTTNTGAVDDLATQAEIAARHGLWHHVDAAYGGFFMLTGEGRRLMRGIERADSITLDPHKGLFVPYGTGCLLVREQETLERTHSIEADYMPRLQKSPDLVDFCQLSPELSRDFRGLRIWLPLKMHGIEPFRRNLEEKLELARWAAARLREMEGIELVAAPQLSTVAFRLRPPGLPADQLDPLNERFLEAINRCQRVYLTPTRLEGRFVLRISVLSFRTHHEHLEAALEAIERARREVL